MKKLLVKLLIAAAACVGCNWGIGGFAAACGAPTVVPWEIGIPLLMILFQAIVILTGVIRPLSEKKHRMIYWIVSELLFAATLGIWGTVILMTLLI